MAIERIKLNLIPTGTMPVCHASQYDKGRKIGLDIYNGLQPYILSDELLELDVRKSDGHIVTIDVPYTAGGNGVVFETTEQMCAVAGSNLCELKITKGEAEIGSLNFYMEIERSPMENGLASDSEIANLTTQMRAIAEPMVEEIAPPIVEELVPQVIGNNYYTKTQTDEAIATAIEGKADTTYVDTELANKMDKANPTGTGSLSLNRKAGSTVGSNSVAMGTNTRATGTNTTALGNDTLAYGENSVAMGSGCSVSGTNSVAIGNHTKANSNNQFVFGKYNKDDNNNAYAEIVGNGTTAFTKSNARTLDWQGNETLAGDLTFNGNKSLTSEISRLDGRIDNLPAPMIFKGTLGVGGTIQSLPTASASNEGWTYKVITDGSYAGQTAKVGDVFTSNGSAWVYIPSGDEDNDTWRNIKVNGTEVLGNGISSGAVDFVGSENIEVDFDGNGNKVGVKTKNIYTKTEVDNIVANEVSEAIYGILPSELTPTDAIANFSTTLELPIVDINVDNSATKIYQFGSNLWNGEWEQGTYDTTTGEKTASTTLKRNINPIPVKENTAYTRVKKQEGALLACRLFFYDDDMNLLSTEVNTSNIYSFTTPVGCSFLNFAFQNNITALSVNYPNTDTALNTYNPASGEYPIAEKDNIIPFVGVNNIFTDVGDISVEYKVSIEQYVSNHSGGGLGSGLLGGGLGGAKSGGSEEEPTEESEETEKTKEIDEPKEEIKTIGDTKKLGGEGNE